MYMSVWLFCAMLSPTVCKVSLLPSNTLSGTIWSWMMSIVCMTMGKSVAPYSFCPRSTESENLKKKLTSFQYVEFRILREGIKETGAK